MCAVMCEPSTARHVQAGAARVSVLIEAHWLEQPGDAIQSWVVSWRCSARVLVTQPRVCGLHGGRIALAQCFTGKHMEESKQSL